MRKIYCTNDEIRLGKKYFVRSDFTWPISTKLGTKQTRLKFVKLCSNEGPRPFQGEIITK